MANGGQVECFVVVSAYGEHWAIAQSRCLGLTGTDIHTYIHIYIHTYIQTGDDNASLLLASPFGSAIIYYTGRGLLYMYMQWWENDDDGSDDIIQLQEW